MVVISEREDAITSVGFNQSSAGEVSQMERETRMSVWNPSRVFPYTTKRLRVKSREAYHLFYFFFPLGFAGFVNRGIDFLVP